MIQIALCDDERETLYCLEERINYYAKKRSISLYVDKFYQAKELKEQIQYGKNYQIYFLDMLMPEMNGIEIGEIIRKQDEDAIIIYLTSFADYAFQAFGVFAQRYLLKPMKQKEFEEAMDFAIDYALQKQKVFNVNTSDGIQTILYHKIEYVENVSRTLHIFSIDGKQIISRFLRKSFENDIEKLLESRDFIQVHKSFIVNLRHIKLYSQNQITMRSERLIPISKSRQTEVKRMYLQYISQN